MGLNTSLPPGTICTVSDGEVQAVGNRPSEMLRAGRWMQPLLTLAPGMAIPEVARRVDALLAHIGRTANSRIWMSRSLRSLGEYGAVPLLKFLTADEIGQRPCHEGD